MAMNGPNIGIEIHRTFCHCYQDNLPSYYEYKNVLFIDTTAYDEEWVWLKKYRVQLYLQLTLERTNEPDLLFAS